MVGRLRERFKEGQPFSEMLDCFLIGRASQRRLPGLPSILYGAVVILSFFKMYGKFGRPLTRMRSSSAL
jgi:hypothetical protein